MATYYKDSNNGVVAIVSEAVYKEMQAWNQICRECEKEGLPRPQRPPILPVFTFSDPTHGAFKFMTGSYAILTRLLKGQTVLDGSFWVPFSNGIQWRPNNEARWELEYMTTLDDVFKHFPVTIVE